MGNVNIGHLYKKRTIRNLSGGIIDMVDEANGGVIISKGRVVNQNRVDELAAQERDKKSAATAFTAEVAAPQAIIEQRTVAPTKMQELEKKVEAQDEKLNQILELLKKK